MKRTEDDIDVINQQIAASLKIIAVPFQIVGWLIGLAISCAIIGFALFLILLAGIGLGEIGEVIAATFGPNFLQYSFTACVVAGGIYFNFIAK